MIAIYLFTGHAISIPHSASNTSKTSAAAADCGWRLVIKAVIRGLCREYIVYRLQKTGV